MVQHSRAVRRALASLALPVFLCGCSASGDEILLEYETSTQEVPEEDVVTFFGYKADAINLTAIEKALGGFMEENPDIYVAYEGIKGQPYWDTFALRVEMDNMDDIMMLDHDRILSLSSENRLADLSALSTVDNFIPWAKDQFTGEDGSVYFLPTCISTYNLYINTELLEAHGQTLPADWSEFTEVCDYFTDKGITPIIANNYGSLSTLIIAKGMYPVYHGEDSDEWIARFNSGEADFCEQVRPGLEMVAEMKERGWIDAEELLATNQTSDDLELFSKGDRPFMLSGGWASPRLNVDFSYGVYPYPILEDGSVLVMNVDTCVGVNADSNRQEEAKKLVEYITQTDVMWEYCDSQSSFSPLQEERMPSDETIAPSAPYLTNGRHVLRADYRLDFPIDTTLRECSNEMMQGMDVEEALELLHSLIYSSENAGGAS